MGVGKKRTDSKQAHTHTHTLSGDEARGEMKAYQLTSGELCEVKREGEREREGHRVSCW